MAMTDVALQPGSPEIPDKLYFKIGEVSELLGVEPYVLRYWEGGIPRLSPKKSGTGHRLYRRKDVEAAAPDQAPAVREAIHDRGRPSKSSTRRRKRSQTRRGAKRFSRNCSATDPLPEIRRELVGYSRDAEVMQK